MVWSNPAVTVHGGPWDGTAVAWPPSKRFQLIEQGEYWLDDNWKTATWHPNAKPKTERTRGA